MTDPVNVSYSELDLYPLEAVMEAGKHSFPTAEVDDESC